MSELDIRNTYIKNDKGRLRELYLKLADECGVKPYNDSTFDFDAIECTDKVRGEFIIYGFESEADDFEDESSELTLAQLEAHFADADKPDWDGEGLPPVGVECHVNRDSFTYRVMYSSDWVVIVQNLSSDNTSADGMDIILDLKRGDYTFRPIETQAQKDERERIEAAYDLYCVAMKGASDTPQSFEHFVKNKYKSAWLPVVDKTGYRKP